MSWLPLMLGVASLLVLQVVIVSGKQQGTWTLLACLAGFLASVIAIGAWIRPPRFLPDASTSSLAAKLAQDIRFALSDQLRPEFMLVDGGSFTARGLDEAQFQSRVNSKTGRKVQVIFLALPGGNQPERRVVLEDAISMLTREERNRLHASRMTILLEIHESYDRHPTAQLGRNPRSDRAFAYLRPGVARDVVLDSPWDTDELEDVKLLKDVVLIGASNLLNVGLATRMFPADEVKRQTDEQLLLRPDEDFRFPGLRGLLRAVGKMDTRIVTDFPDANIHKRRERIVSALGVPDAQVVYFSVPSTTLRHLRYSRGFCAEYNANSEACITHSNRWLLRRLNHKKYWYDGGHLLKPGAAQYTRWLADQVALAMAGEGREAAQ